MPRTIKDCRILLIEDERSVREILKGLLKYIGVKEVDDYSSAESGWDALMGTKAQPFDVVFIDLSLPGIGGEVFIKSLRQLPHPRAKTIPLIVLTATNDPAMYKKIERYGITAYLIKPASADVLKAAIEQALSGRIANARPVSTVPQVG